MTIAVALAAVAQRLADRVLFVRRLERQSRTPRGADRNRIPPVRRSRELARHFVPRIRRDRAIAGRPKEAGDLEGGRHRHDQDIIAVNDLSATNLE